MTRIQFGWSLPSSPSEGMSRNAYMESVQKGFELIKGHFDSFWFVDVIIGTSAGSVVGAQIASGTDLESLFASQLTPVEQSKERMVAFDPIQMMEAFSQAVAGVGPDLKAMRARK